MSAVHDFEDFARELGFNIGAVVSEKITRFDIGKKKKRGWYVAHLDAARPYAIIADHANGGERHTWQYQGETERISPEEYKRRRAAQKQAEREHRQAEEALRRVAQSKAREAWQKMPAADPEHEYLTKKQIKPHNARQKGAAIAVPMFDQRGQIVSFQAISADGRKQFVKDAGKKGYYNYIGQDYRSADQIFICEGFSTAASISEAIPSAAVIIAFDAGNIEPVAKFFATIRPATCITICGDNDRFIPDEKGGNVGLIKATHAAKCINSVAIIPNFSNQDTTGTDFNDLACARGLDEVRRQIIGEPAKPKLTLVKSDNSNWRNDPRIIHDDKGQVAKKFFFNFRFFLTNGLKDTFRLNNFTGQIMVQHAPWAQRDKLRPIQDNDYTYAREWLQGNTLLPTGSETVDAIALVAAENGYDPVCDYLNELVWDKKERLSGLFSYYFAASHTAWEELISVKFMISAVARAMQAGCKVDNMVILEGEQGARKSSAIAALFGAEYTRSSTNVLNSSKELIEIATGAWVIEIAEFAAMTRPQFRDKITALITTQEDTARMAYQRTTRTQKRRSIFIGSINPTDNGYLTDPTGNRRFWPIRCGDIDLAAIRADRDQLWAEAVHRYKAGERWWLEDTFEHELARAETAERLEVDPWEELLLGLLRDLDTITTPEVFNLLDILKQQQTKVLANRLSGVMRKIGFIYGLVYRNSVRVKGWKRD